MCALPRPLNPTTATLTVLFGLWSALALRAAGNATELKRKCRLSTSVITNLRSALGAGPLLLRGVYARQAWRVDLSRRTGSTISVPTSGIPERPHRVDVHGSASGDGAGQQPDEHQRRGHGNPSHRGGRVGTKEVPAH